MVLIAGGILEIDAEIEMLKRRMQSTKSHIAKIELQKRLMELEEKKRSQRAKESWEM